jgi:hypothetical protein
MDKVKTLSAADWMFIIAILALIYFTWRSTAAFSAQDFGVGVGTIFGGKGAHLWGKSQMPPDSP